MLSKLSIFIIFSFSTTKYGFTQSHFLPLTIFIKADTTIISKIHKNGQSSVLSIEVDVINHNQTDFAIFPSNNTVNIYPAQDSIIIPSGLGIFEKKGLYGRCYLRDLNTDSILTSVSHPCQDGILYPPLTKMQKVFLRKKRVLYVPKNSIIKSTLFAIVPTSLLHAGIFKLESFYFESFFKTYYYNGHIPNQEANLPKIKIHKNSRLYEGNFITSGFTYLKIK